MNVYKINKLKQKIELSLEGCQPMRGQVFLSKVCSQHHGEERVLDMLVAPEAFFPFESDGGVLWIVQRKSVQKVVVDSTFELEILRSYGEDSPVTKDVSVQLTSGQELTGRLVIEPREGASRVLDEMNRERGFFILLSGEDCSIIGSRYVSSLREV